MNKVHGTHRIIKVTVKLFASFKKITNAREIEIELEEKATVFQLLEALFNQHQSLREKIFDDYNELRDWIQILRNGRSIKYLDGIKTHLNDGDVIAVFPPVAGGLFSKI
ncbi:MAG: ubiquitin-like small modifier protein 1 [Promethearchaeota archaeon]